MDLHTRLINTHLLAMRIVFLTLIHVFASFPVRGQGVTFGAQAKDLTVTVDAVMRAASVVDVTPIYTLAGVAVLGQDRTNGLA